MAATRQYCITCPRSDWQAIRALAKEAGMKTSPFILREVLGEDCRLALTGAEQRELHACAVRLASLGADLLAPLPGSGVTLAEALAFLGSELRSRQETEHGRSRPGAGGGEGAAGPPGAGPP